MENVVGEIKQFFRGEILTDFAHISGYNSDLSPLYVLPKIVVIPLDSSDLASLIRWLSLYNKRYPELSLSVRGSNASSIGSSLTPGIMVDLRRLSEVYSIDNNKIMFGAGAKASSVHNLNRVSKYLPDVEPNDTNSSIGGLIATNARASYNLHGTIGDSIKALKVILADGREYTFCKINKRELVAKIKQKDFEGHIYREVYKLITNNSNLLENIYSGSMGYIISNIFDRETESIDLSKLFLASEGTLGIITKALIEAKPLERYRILTNIYLKNLDHLQKIIDVLNELPVDSVRSFSRGIYSKTLDYIHRADLNEDREEWIYEHDNIFKGVSKNARIPELTLEVVFSGNEPSEVVYKIKQLEAGLDDLPVSYEIVKYKEDRKRFERMEDFKPITKFFGLETKSLGGLDDLYIPVSKIEKFIKKAKRYFNSNHIKFEMSGSLVNGHIQLYPYWKQNEVLTKTMIHNLLLDLYTLVKEYGGHISFSQGDGLIKAPFIPMFKTKEQIDFEINLKLIFDPDNIFSRNKKYDASWSKTAKYLKK